MSMKATADIAFKHLLSPNVESNKEILISFLNTFVPAYRGDKVQSVESMPSFVPVLPEKREKQTFMDFAVNSETGNKYIVEMQYSRHAMFNERALFYAASVYARQPLPRAKYWYHYLKPVIGLQILDYDTNLVRGITKIPDSIAESDSLFVDMVKNFPMKEDQFFKHFMMTDVTSGQNIDYLQVVQIDLPRAERILSQKQMTREDLLEWWINVFTHAQEYTHEDVDRMYQDKVMPEIIYKALGRLDINKWNPKMRKEYKDELLSYENNAIVLEVEKAKGVLEEKMKIARKLLDRGRPLAEIEEDTGLTAKEIISMKKSG